MKLTISIAPELHAKLPDYAAAYAQAYEIEEPVAELIPAMLDAFMDGDRGFARSRYDRPWPRLTASFPAAANL